jgi:hypothetical protein
VQQQVGTEVERANDLVRSALRCVAAISHLEDIEVRSAAIKYNSNMSACASTALILHDVPISIACAVARHQVAASIACNAHVDGCYCLHASAQQFVC